MTPEYRQRKIEWNFNPILDLLFSILLWNSSSLLSSHVAAAVRHTVLKLSTSSESQKRVILSASRQVLLFIDLMTHFTSRISLPLSCNEAVTLCGRSWFSFLSNQTFCVRPWPGAWGGRPVWPCLFYLLLFGVLFYLFPLKQVHFWQHSLYEVHFCFGSDVQFKCGFKANCQSWKSCLTN